MSGPAFNARKSNASGNVSLRVKEINIAGSNLGGIEIEDQLIEVMKRRTRRAAQGHRARYHQIRHLGRHRPRVVPDDE